MRRVLLTGLVLLGGCAAVTNVGEPEDYCFLRTGLPGECNAVFPQCGCAEDETCSEAQTCIPAGELAPGARCTQGMRECPSGTTCIGPPSRTLGHCQPLCITDADCAAGPFGAGSGCFLGTESDTVPSGLGVCTVPCEIGPDGDAACGERSFCGGFGPFQLCLEAGDQQRGDPCDPAVCAPPLLCTSLGDGLRCRAPCGPGYDPCAVGQRCVLPTPEGSAEVLDGQWGVCAAL